jgi:hypothetical protein
MRKASMATRRELVLAVTERFLSSQEKAFGECLEDLVADRPGNRRQDLSKRVSPIEWRDARFRVNFRAMVLSQADSHAVWNPIKYIGTRILLVRSPSTIDVCFIRRSNPEIIESNKRHNLLIKALAIIIGKQFVTFILNLRRLNIPVRLERSIIGRLGANTR